MTSLENSDHNHCSKCVTPTTCTTLNHCPIVACINNCSFKYHLCKQTEHLENTCPNQFVDCINKCNGCRLEIKRSELGEHLKNCSASIIQCNSYRVRRLINKDEKYSRLKWPCPISTESIDLATITCEFRTKHSNANNLSRILLNQDYESLKKFSQERPLRFSRLYGYLIGHDVAKDYSNVPLFSFLSRLLRNVKSQIFKDIEAENCIVFNTELGCAACRYRIKNYEIDRYTHILQNHFDSFYSVLKNVNDYEQFVEEEIYSKPEFLKIYEQFYFKPKKTRPQDLEVDNLNDKELNEKLIENNKGIIKVIELNETLRLNESKEVPCDAFYDHSDAYRLKETTFTTTCDHILRRDEYTDHYSLFHNYLLPSAEQIDFKCPLAQYGCQYYERKSEFYFGKDESHRYLNLKHPVADLVDSDLTGLLAFNLDAMSSIHQSSKSEHWNLMNLPFDVLYDIIDRLDSLSLYCLSLTCKDLRNICEKFLLLRGIVYPKWSRKKNHIPEELSESLDDETRFSQYRWTIDTYAFSFSKHIQNPTEIKFKQSTECNMHLQTCPYRRVRDIKQKFKIY